ncbi:MAG: exodeoxyribonuclease V subunit alpha [Planctomycetes bacterium]|nr:exodeoxyribonuclease V subunit alpha [Planctomycetota bacterium]
MQGDHEWACLRGSRIARIHLPPRRQRGPHPRRLLAGPGKVAAGPARKPSGHRRRQPLSTRPRKRPASLPRKVLGSPAPAGRRDRGEARAAAGFTRRRGPAPGHREVVCPRRRRAGLAESGRRGRPAEQLHRDLGRPRYGKDDDDRQDPRAALRASSERGLPPLLIDLLAPTGKAAARLEESVRTAGSGLELPEETRRLIQLAGATLHRRLGYSRRGFGSFRHGKDNPLGSDVVIVDEASMIDLSMMTRLFEAVPRSSRLILIGDEHQLASVEAGAILGDICDSGRRSGWSPSFLEKLEALTGSTYHQASSKEESPLADCIVELQRSYRFDDSSGIGKFARLVRDGEAAKAVECLQAAEHEDISQLTAKEPGGIEESTREIILEAYEGYLKQADPVLRMEAFNSFRILCAHRRGPHGVSNLNRLVETALEGAGLLTREGWWYHGRPILITRNDYQLDLFNGDTGLIVRDEERDGALRAQFIDPEGRIRSFAPARLPPHETAYAMTIHKSQGSEFDRVFVVLPNGPSLILSRELIYTAITRAKKKVILLGDEDTITAGIEKKIERASGLRRALWGEG